MGLRNLPECCVCVFLQKPSNLTVPALESAAAAAGQSLPELRLDFHKTLWRVLQKRTQQLPLPHPLWAASFFTFRPYLVRGKSHPAGVHRFWSLSVPRTFDLDGLGRSFSRFSSVWVASFFGDLFLKGWLFLKGADLRTFVKQSCVFVNSWHLNGALSCPGTAPWSRVLLIRRSLLFSCEMKSFPFAKGGCVLLLLNSVQGQAQDFPRLPFE